MIRRELFTKCFCTDRKISDFAIYLLCALMVILLTPILARNIPNFLIILLMLLFVVSAFPRLRVLRKGDMRVLILLAVCMTVETVYKLIGRSSAALYYYFNTVQFFFFLGAGIMIYSALNRKQVVLLLKVAVGALLFTCLYNVILFFIHGADAYVTLFQENKYATNAINTPYASAIMLVSGGALICGLHKRNLRIRSIACVLSLFGFLFVALVTQRMIAVLLSLLMYALIFCSYIKENPLNKLSSKNRKIAIAVIIAAIVLLLLLLVPILRLIRSMVGSERLVRRINQIIRLLKTGNIDEAGGSLAVRFRMMGVSLRTFTSSFANFMIGAGDHRITNEIIGNHSLLFDEFARYGILFAPITVYLLYCALQAVRKMAVIKPRTIISRQLNALLITITLRSVVGTIFDASVGICLFIIIPLLLKAIRFRQYPVREADRQDL